MMNKNKKERKKGKENDRRILEEPTENKERNERREQ